MRRLMPFPAETQMMEGFDSLGHLPGGNIVEPPPDMVMFPFISPVKPTNLQHLGKPGESDITMIHICLRRTVSFLEVPFPAPGISSVRDDPFRPVRCHV